MGDSLISDRTDWERLVDIRGRFTRNRLIRGDIAWLIGIATQSIVAEVDTESSREPGERPAEEKIAGGPLAGLSPKMTGD